MNDVVLEAEQLEKALRIIEAHGYTPISKKAKIDEAIKTAREAVESDSNSGGKGEGRKQEKS